ncbi:NAD(P)/FAD-dependent oxidoreductase [Mitsuokella jalaludinii]|uniref:NAD(P)/FAD-dependent oxidoreductase n=1 Tax=Mitsuokella jalaludinii TaxID=187979 RepID=UPI00307C72E8
MIRIRNLAVPFTERASLEDLAAKRLMLPPQQIAGVVIVRKAVDARRYHGAPIQFVYILDVKLEGKVEKKVLQKLRRDRNVEEAPVPQAPAPIPAPHLERRPVIVGFGPAGMFAALTLARHGCEPLVLERGNDVDTRHEDIERFWQGGALNPQSNVQFGEGGAGTFSDGKLTTRINDAHMKDVIEAFVAAGAPEEIRYLHKPHIGTDILREVVRNIRKEIIRLGGTVRFGAQVTDIELGEEGVEAVIVNDEERIEADVVFFGIGHSARDTYRMLLSRGVAMEAKPFAMGVRIEHPQEFIDRAQYGEDAGNPRLPVADYALTYKDPATGRGAYSFCMCPGGFVVAAASEKERVVTNGMSNYRRDSGIANSALLVQVAPADFGQEVLAGMALQQELEGLAFALGGRDYFAPVQTVGDFLKGRSGSTDFLTKPTYAPGVRAADLHRCLPDFITKTLTGALPYFDRKIPGFADAGAIMTGVETRSSAPCRIRRDRETFVAEATPGLYPMGEGAGYAGGIMSAAVDGMKAALAFLHQNVQY